MELFSASSAWSWILLFAVMLGSLLLGNVLKKLIKPLGENTPKIEEN